MSATGNGHSTPAEPATNADAAPPPIATSELLRLYVVLQVGAGLLLAVAFAIVAALRPLFGGGDAFLRSWVVTFVLAPITFVPVLVRWNRWAYARIGRRSGWIRVLAELACAVEVIACVLLQRIA